MKEKATQGRYWGWKPGTLTPAQRDAIQEEYEAGATRTELALKYGVPVSTIRGAVNARPDR